jgi:purine-binding chemotaxis protein CheW
MARADAVARASRNGAIAATDPRAGKYLTFRLEGEEFGVSVARIREIMSVQQITAVPHTPPYTKGVINLRGKVIPVVDLRLKFGMSGAEITSQTCIIVTEVKVDTRPVLMGVLVDDVSEVLMLGDQDIQDTPEFGDGHAPPGVLGVAKNKGRVKILLDIDHVLTCQDLIQLEAAVQ